METIFCKNRDEWRIWLEQNHTIEKEIWLIYFKKHTKRETVVYNEAVEEALCFGWIDSTIKSIDGETYMQRYTPRNKNSVWSLVNKKRIQKLIAENKMTPAGLDLVAIAKKNGQWEKAYSSSKDVIMPKEMQDALEKNPLAFKNFYNFPPSVQREYKRWVSAARKPETIHKRITIVIERSERNEKAGML